METWREGCNKVKLTKDQMPLVRMNVMVTVDHSVGKNLRMVYFMERIFLYSQSSSCTYHGP